MSMYTKTKSNRSFIRAEEKVDAEAESLDCDQLVAIAIISNHLSSIFL